MKFTIPNYDQDPTGESYLMQRSLKTLGFYLGGVDNIFGDKSKAALAAYKLAISQSNAQQVSDREAAAAVPAPAPSGRIIHGSDAWKFSAVVGGDDLLLLDVKATAFGGDSDSMDSGETASGYNTKGHPDLVAVSLPMNNDRLHDAEHGYVLKDSPIPWMPFGLNPNGSDRAEGCHVDVEFIGTGVKVENVPVIDLGPANYTGNALDCSVGLARKVDKHATANSFGARVNVRIRGAAKYLKP